MSENLGNISFIMPCYNCADTIDETVQSIISSNMMQGDEIIMVDDASMDDTYSKLEEYANKYAFVKVLKHNINKGTAAAGRNTAIDASKNEILFCIDADNVLYPDSIGSLKEFFLANNLDAAAFGVIEYFRENTANVTHSWLLSTELNFIEALNDPTKTPCGSGNYMLTKAIWKKVGRYNEFVGGAFDSELFGLKLLAEGAKFHTLKHTSYLHRYGYDSTYVKNYDKKNTSLLFLSALIDYIDQIHTADVEYIFSDGRFTWRDNINQRPLRKREHQASKSVLDKIRGLYK